MSIHWIAYYNDGSYLEQVNGATYRDIDRAKLTAFSLVNNAGRIIILIDLTDDTNDDPDIGPKRLIWRKRGQLSTNGNNTHVYLVGWQRQIKGRNVQSICYVKEDETIVLGGQWIEDRPLMHAIKPLEFETDLV